VGRPVGHTLVTRAKIRLLEDQLKEATVDECTIFYDKAQTRRDGSCTLSPLEYFAAAIGF